MELYIIYLWYAILSILSKSNWVNKSHYSVDEIIVLGFVLVFQILNTFNGGIQFSIEMLLLCGLFVLDFAWISEVGHQYKFLNCFVVSL